MPQNQPLDSWIRGFLNSIKGIVSTKSKFGSVGDFGMEIHPISFFVLHGAKTNVHPLSVFHSQPAPPSCESPTLPSWSIPNIELDLHKPEPAKHNKSNGKRQSPGRKIISNAWAWLVPHQYESPSPFFETRLQEVPRSKDARKSWQSLLTSMSPEAKSSKMNMIWGFGGLSSCDVLSHTRLYHALTEGWALFTCSMRILPTVLMSSTCFSWHGGSWREQHQKIQKMWANGRMFYQSGHFQWAILR